jgi:deoxyribodipyrimidine photolyase-related protein
VLETKKNAYAHHIQRLMVLGNFTLLAGVDPCYVNQWYLIVYADAFEWVEMPNVSGMVLFADGGMLASKPYASGGAYINKMSNYCEACSYDIKKKHGDSACPFNYLYWNFLLTNQNKLKTNHRLAMMYKTIEKMSDDKIKTIKSEAKRFLASLDN